MLLTEYNEAEQMELFKEDGRREGRAEGRAEGRVEGRAEGRVEGRAEGIIETLVSLVRKGLLSMKDAADQAGMTETTFRQKMISQ